MTDQQLLTAMLRKAAIPYQEIPKGALYEPGYPGRSDCDRIVVIKGDGTCVFAFADDGSLASVEAWT